MINFIAPLIFSVFFAYGEANAEDYLPSRLDNLLKIVPVTQKLERHGLPSAIFSSYKDLDMSSPAFGVELCVLEIPKKTGLLRVKDLRLEGISVEIFQSNTPSTSLGAISGGFFGINGYGKMIPLGLVKSEGRVLSKLHKWKSGGVVAALHDHIEIIPISKFSDKEAYINIIQSKPLLVENGRNGIRSATSDKFDRSAIAIDESGSIYLFVLYEPAGSAASLAEFSALIQAFQPTNKSVISFALAMDGGPGAQMYIPALKKHCGSKVKTFIPNMVYVAK